MSRAAVRLTQDALAKGCVALLATRGGWREERHLRDGQGVGGRIWQRSRPADLALTFSRHSLEFLIWITAARPGDKEPPWEPPYEQLTPGDLLLLYFAHQGLRDGAASLGAADLWRRQPFARHGLCRLAYPEDYAAALPPAQPDFSVWTKGVGAAMLESLQPELTARWVALEYAKASITDPARMQALGQSQEWALTGFLDAIEQAGRLDLARFLLDAARRLLGSHVTAAMWVEALDLRGMRLVDRTAIYRAALTFLRQLERLQAWERRARNVGYFDDGYAASQLWKADWEQREGDVLCARAQAIARQLDPMTRGQS